MGKLIDSDYLLLDVKRGRKALAKRLKNDGTVRVSILADISYPFGDDDGESIEFVCHVHNVTEAP